MGPTDRLAQLNREKGRALVRTLHLSELQAAGAARAVALHEAEAQLDRIARVLPDALRAGVPLTEISRRTGVSRQTLYDLKTRYTTAASTELAVLEALATRAPITREDLVTRLERPNGDVEEVVERLLQRGLAQVSVAPEEYGGDTYLGLTGEGARHLEQWWESGEKAQDA